jgi:hypothetical protein
MKVSIYRYMTGTITLPRAPYIEGPVGLQDLGIDQVGSEEQPLEFRNLFESCKDYGAEMLERDERRGVFALYGAKDELARVRYPNKVAVAACQDLTGKYREKVLLDRGRIDTLLRELKDDCIILFDPEGKIFEIGGHINTVASDIADCILDDVMQLRNQDYTRGEKHMAALWSTGFAPVKAVTVSENQWHACMAFEKGRIIWEMTYDPITRLGGYELRDAHYSRLLATERASRLNDIKRGEGNGRREL